MGTSRAAIRHLPIHSFVHFKRLCFYQLVEVSGFFLQSLVYDILIDFLVI